MAVQERYVRFRYFDWFVPVEDPVTLEEIRVSRHATHGMKVSTAESGDEPHTAYGLPEERLRWGDLNGAFFSEAEVEAMEAGLSDSMTPMESETAPRGDTTSTPGPTSLAQATAISPPAIHPVAFDELNALEMAEYMKEAKLDTNAILKMASDSPHQAEFLYSAAVIANDGAPPAELSAGIAEILGYGAADPGLTGRGVEYDGETTEDAGPTQEGATEPYEVEGTPGVGGGTTTEATGDESEGGEGTDTEGSGTSEGESTPEPSDAAVALAKEKDVDLANVTGTGKDGRVTQQDVQKYLSEQEGQS